jgi:putative inorganic carbon (hco3(-)) transporter
MLFYPQMKSYFKPFILLFLLLFSIALLLSYTRAAWISIFGVLGLAILILLKVRLRFIIVASIIAIGILFTYRVEIIDKLNKNKQDSSEELSEHLKSVSNIATDASNLERINRWNSALKMFKERPVLGWGPGTYMFQYAPFQMSGDKTIISTNFGDVGNAHSEYISPLVEQGVPGLICFLLVIIATIYTSLKLFYQSGNSKVKLLSLICLLSLTTYLIHGLLNNYLDTDKASVPFWGLIALICSLDIYSLSENKNPQLGGAEER